MRPLRLILDYKFLSLLTVLLAGLKLTHHIVWSWLWVVSPLWLPIAIMLALIIIVIILNIIFA
jgi:hypothetical protein